MDYPDKTRRVDLNKERKRRRRFFRAISIIEVMAAISLVAYIVRTAINAN